MSNPATHASTARPMTTAIGEKLPRMASHAPTGATARAFHVAAIGFLAAVYPLANVHPIYLAGVAGIAALPAYEHSLVKADDLSRVDAAFFTLNGWVSVGYLAVTLAAISAAR